jgi:hypothetical protein
MTDTIKQNVQIFNRDGKQVDAFAVEMDPDNRLNFDKIRELMSCDYVTFVDRIGNIHGFRMEHVIEIKVS